MPRLRALEGGGAGGLDPRRARLARIHEVAVLGMAGGGGSFLVVGFFFGLGHWGPLVSVITKASLAALAVTTVSCVATIYTVAMIFDTDPRTVREMREAGLDDPD